MMSNEVTERPIMQSGLTKINDVYMPQIESQLQGNGLVMTDYQKQCVLSSIQAINTVLTNSGISINDVDQSNMTDILLTVAALQLNSSAVPREVYFQTRNVKRKGIDPDTGKPKDIWIKQIEMGIEGDGNDAILSRFGRNVKKVHRFWEVRQGDHFTYPGYKGIELTPPEWQPTGEGDVIRIVYPVEMTDGTIEYHIAERKDVVRNLIAHISNNLMNETFGIVQGTKEYYGKKVPRTKFDATSEEKKKIESKKKEIMAALKDKSLDDILGDESLQKYISPAWKSAQSSESMIIRKMRNNVVKKIPKNFENAYVAMKYQEQEDEVIKSVRKDVTDNSNQEIVDFEENPESEEEIPEATPYDDSQQGEIVDDVQGSSNDGPDENLPETFVQESLLEDRTTKPKKRGF